MVEISSSVEMIKLLLADGWYLKRAKGSHHHFKHPTKTGTNGYGTAPHEGPTFRNGKKHPAAGWTESEVKEEHILRKQDHYTFPAVFFPDGQCVGVKFPDLPGCNTFGKDMDDALCMARDALGGHLLCFDDDGETIPSPTHFAQIKTKRGEIVVFVEVWLSALREEERNKSVKKTVILPNWLNLEASKAEINFSLVLQEALKEKLGHKETVNV